jgi:hypothetical protein
MGLSAGSVRQVQLFCRQRDITPGDPVIPETHGSAYAILLKERTNVAVLRIETDIPVEFPIVRMFHIPASRGPNVMTRRGVSAENHDAI